MKFIVLRSGKSTLKFSEKGFLLGPDSRQLYSPENAYLYTYTSGEKKMYHLLVQSGKELHHFTSTLFFAENELTKALQAHSEIHKASFELRDVQIYKFSGSLLHEKGNLIWGPAKGGGYEFIFKLPYRKEWLLLSASRPDVSYENLWTFSEDEITDNELEVKPVIEPKYGIWENNRDFWKRYYKQKENTEDTRWGCQKQFLIVLAIIVLWILYNWIIN